MWPIQYRLSNLHKIDPKKRSFFAASLILPNLHIIHIMSTECSPASNMACKSKAQRLKEINMLVLTRKTDESIQIGREGEVKITILEIRRGFIRIGVEAPKQIPIHREEVFERIQQERAAETLVDQVESADSL